MSETGTLNSRILLRHDTRENWEAHGDTVLMAGEVGLVTEQQDAGTPVILMKVGDGATPFSNLPCLSARAADVSGWAKAGKKPGYTAEEIDGLDTYVAARVSEDTDTRYRLVLDESEKETGHLVTIRLQSAEKDSDSYTDVSDIPLELYDETPLREDYQSLKELVGGVPVSEQIQTALKDAGWEIATDDDVTRVLDEVFGAA